MSTKFGIAHIAFHTFMMCFFLATYVAVEKDNPPTEWEKQVERLTRLENTKEWIERYPELFKKNSLTR